MNVKKAIKRIAAIGTGAAMLGATILGAVAAADLSQYPSPLFIGTDGKFNALLVVGKAASSEDIIGAIDVATALQAASITTTTSGATTTVLEGGVKVETAGQKLYLGQTLSVVKTALTSSDLTKVLASGSITDEDGTAWDYNQKINILNSTAKITFGTPTGLSNDPQVYLNLPSGAKYVAQIEFPSAVTTTKLNNKLITLFGKEYTFAGTDAELVVNSTTGLVLFGGGTDQTFSAGEAITVTVAGTDVSVEVTGVNTGTTTSTATIKVNGESASVTAGEVVVLGGIRVYVRDIFAYTTPVTSGAVRLFIGSDKLILRNGEAARMASSDIDGTTVVASVSGSTITKLAIAVEPYNMDPEFRYLKSGESFTDPVFGTFKWSFTGTTPALDDASRDVIKIYPTGEDTAAIEFTNKAGQKYSTKFLKGTATSGTANCDLGVDSYKLWTNLSFASGQIAMVENDYFIIDQGGYSHIMQVKRINAGSSSPEVKIKDIASGSDTLTLSLDSTNSSTFSLDGYTYNVMVNATNSGINVTTSSGGKALQNYVYAKGGEKIAFPANLTGVSGVVSCNITITQETQYNDGDYYNLTAAGTSNQKLGDAGNDINITLNQIADSKYDMQVATPTGDGLAMGTIGSTYDQRGMSQYGTYVKYNTDTDILELLYPSAATAYTVFVAPTAATTTTSGGTTTQTVNVWNVGTAKLDSEVADIKAQNAIIIGGPCANTAAAAIMGSPSPCGKDFTEGKAMVKLYENAGKVAMLVAGYNAEDTRRASRVASQWSKYASSMKGAEVTVTGTSLTDITVAAAQ
ncbi:MAG: S-layer protein [Candidatus Woesearchaeota archaeon]|nr:S-layer protein [Candidatus Woesearchaeota archaeon]